MSSIDHSKRTEPLKLWLTERELIDLSRRAVAEDRKVGEMGRVAISLYLYGTVGARTDEVHGANSPEGGHA